MLIAVIPVRNVSALSHLTDGLPQADGVELRLDYADPLPIDTLSQIRKALSLPVMFTLRSREQGGHYPYDEAQRLTDLYRLAQLKPDYIDIEYNVPDTWLNAFANTYPHIKLIRSYHHFHATPTDLEALFADLYHPLIHTYKIATFANNTADALRMMQWVRQMSKHHRITGLCMGIDGQCTRILGPVMGNTFHYAPVDQNAITAPGQLTMDTLCTTYRLRELNHDTAVFALLGDPIDGSIGHIMHNKAMKRLQKNAVYIKLRVPKEELVDVISLCRTLPFAGFSITMPLKECILPLLSIQDHTGAVNTITVRNGHYHGYNTDGLGAMQALTRHYTIRNKHILIIGAGGAARAIAFEAIHAGAHVTIVNRTASRATALATALGCKTVVFEQDFMKKITPDCVINTLPNIAYNNLAMHAYFEAKQWISVTIAMDIVYQPRHTTFLRLARAGRVKTIPGIAMFIAQAHRQLKLWFMPFINDSTCI